MLSLWEILIFGMDVNEVDKGCQVQERQLLFLSFISPSFVFRGYASGCHNPLFLEIFR